MDPAAAERFVRAEGEGPPKKRTTVYLPHALARSLAVYCAERGRDQSGVIAEAVEALLMAEKVKR